MKRALFPLGVVALVALLGLALVHLFRLRFERGDVYPASSTLRADPLGAKALYDGLREIVGYDVRRNYQPLTKRRPGAPLTLVYAGLQRKSVWGDEELKTFQTLVSHGSRAVFAFAPEGFDPGPAPFAPSRTRAAKTAPASPPPVDSSGKGETPPSVLPSEDEPTSDSPSLDSEGVTFGEALRGWGCAFALPRGRASPIPVRRAVATPEARDVEPEISWHGALYFKEMTGPWRTLYTCEGKPVILERPFGEGTIVLAADSYFFSNEALRVERRPRLLTWLIGPPRTVIFDEEHHGISAHANLASLVAKYRLHGVVAGLGVIAALVLWKVGMPLVPKRRDERAGTAELRGKDAEGGFINLLRRSIPPARLIEVCAEEWEKSAGRRATDAERAHVRSVLDSHRTRSGKDAVAAYRTIAEGLQSFRASARNGSL